MLTSFRFSLLHPKRPARDVRGTGARGDVVRAYRRNAEGQSPQASNNKKTQQSPMKNIKNSMKTSKTNTPEQTTKESAQPNNRDHQCPQPEPQAEAPRRGPSPYITKTNLDALNAATQWRGVFCDGPIAHKPTEDADEIPTWIVFIGTKEREPVSKTYECRSIERARILAGSMARDRRIELIDESTEATVS